MEKFYPITMCGAYFTSEYIEAVRKIVFSMGEDECDFEIVEYIKSFLETETDMSQYPTYMKEIVMVCNDDILYEEGEEDPGYYIGIPFFEVPDHFSMKRVCIDVRNLFIASGLISDEMHPDTIRVFSKVLKVEEEDEN